MDYDNKNFWESIDRKRSRDLPNPDPWKRGEVAVVVVAALALLVFLGVILMGRL